MNTDQSSPFTINEKRGTYRATRVFTPQEIISEALRILEASVKPGASFHSPDDAVKYLRLKYSELKYEIFGLIYLDNQNKVVDEEVLFRGTLNSCSIYTREVAINCLEKGCKSILIYHNHPSNLCRESDADVLITRKLESALKNLDIDIIDHIIVTKTDSLSFKEKNLL